MNDNDNAQYAQYAHVVGLETMTTKEHSITRAFEHAKGTKGTHQYKEIGDDIAVGTIYLKKSILNGDVPDTIDVTVVW